MNATENIFAGDKVYKIDCTGNAVTGDEVCFSRATFTGSFRKPKFAGYELVSGKIIKDSYGYQKQQHTFTILLEDGTKTLIKGRNLYRNGVFRKKWRNESERKEALREKYERGDVARSAREFRREVLNPVGF